MSSSKAKRPSGARRVGWALAGAALVAALWVACGGTVPIPRTLQSASPHQRYADSLDDAGLARTQLGLSWMRAGSAALARPGKPPLPFREVVYFDPAVPQAISWSLELSRGQELVVEVVGEPASASATPFVDLFAQKRDSDGPTEALERIASAPAGAPLAWKVKRDGRYLLRVQPELLAGGRHTVTVQALPSLRFPVEGANSRDVGSRFGDPRDGGRRRHHGVDIFAQRNTPALAASDGWVARAGTNRLGGNVIWLRTDDGLTLYYAHLEKQAVRFGARVRQGETVGWVGNSGNARSTPPHLHFGIYEGGPLDPWPFLHRSAAPEEVTADLGLLADWARVSSATANFRTGPSTSTEVVARLGGNTALRLEGARRDWYRASLADGTTGWMHGSLVEAATEPIRRLRVDYPEQLRVRPTARSAALGELASGAEVNVLAEAADGILVATGDGRRGWISRG